MYGLFGDLDQVMGKTITAVDNLRVTDSFLTNAWLYVKVGVVSIILGISVGVFYMAVTILYLMAIFGIFMMLAVGGPFVWLGAFKKTRGMTWGWLRATMNYVLLAMFLSMIAGLFIRIMNTAVADLQGWDIAQDGAFDVSAGRLIFLCWFCIYLLMKAGELSSALTGGVAMSPSIVSSGAGVIGGAFGSAGRGLGKIGDAAAARAGGSTSESFGIRAYSKLRGLK